MRNTIIAIIFMLAFLNVATAQISIMAGVLEGSYNRLADDIKRISTQEITVIESGGSSENYERLQAKQGSIAFLQYDVLLYKQLEEPEVTKKIEVLFPLDYEEIHLIAYKESGINSLKDLEGKRVAIGSPEQGTYVTAKLIKRKTGIEWIDEEISFNDAFVGLLVGTIDAFFFVGAVPVTKLKDLSPDFTTLIKLVPIEAPELDRIYTKTRIRAYAYKWAKEHVNTYAIPLVLAINAENMTDAQKQSVNQMLTDISANMETLRNTGHQKWRRVNFTFGDVDWKLYEKSVELLRKE